MAENLDPFTGLKRQRLPGMHMITACDGGMPLRDALASDFFVTLHDKVEHDCLIKQALDEHVSCVQEAVSNAKSPDGAGLTTIFGLMGSSALAQEEWSYLDFNHAFVFYLMADTAIEQVQRWIAEGSHTPFSLRLFGGEIVTRPQWTIDHWGGPDSDGRREKREYVQRLLAEVGAVEVSP